MSLRFALLGLLDYRGPLTGYEMSRVLQRSPTLFWQASHSQIYPELSRCLRQGLVQVEAVPQREKPDKKIYVVTDDGRAALRIWLGSREEEGAVRDEFLLKIYFSRAVPLEALLARVEERRKIHERRLKVFLDREADLLDRTSGAVTAKPEALREYLVVKRAILEERAGITWCSWVNGFLRRSGESPPPGVFPEAPEPPAPPEPS